MAQKKFAKDFYANLQTEAKASYAKIKEHDPRFSANFTSSSDHPALYQEVFPQDLSLNAAKSPGLTNAIFQSPSFMSSRIIALHYKASDQMGETDFKIYLKKKDAKPLTWKEAQNIGNERQKALLGNLWSIDCAGVDKVYDRSSSCIDRIAGDSGDLHLFPIEVKISGSGIESAKQDGLMACMGRKDKSFSACKIVFALNDAEKVLMIDLNREREINREKETVAVAIHRTADLSVLTEKKISSKAERNKDSGKAE